jgi:two-component system sensor histidine kinase LytS
VWGWIPVAVISAAALVLLVVLGGSALVLPDSLRSQATERTLRTASSTLDRMRSGLTQDNCRAVCQLLLPETKAIAVAMTDREDVLAYVGDLENDFPPGSPIHTPATREVLESGRMETFTAIPTEAQARHADAHHVTPDVVPAGIVVPLVVKEETVGTIKFYYGSRRDIDRTQLAIARGFGELLSTQLSSYELERQAELTARAEVKALQAQINPHFLFNTINTIASLTRTDPARARNLLREFAVFYRQTLENSESRIPLSRELEQTRRYLTFEHARFGEDRIIEAENVDEGCEEVLVPAFIIQPIVENSVRHAMREEGPLHIDIHVAVDGDDVCIAVADDGLGMDEACAAALLDGSAKPASGSPKGTGIALRNVAERLERFYGFDSGVDIVSKPGEGTCVTLRLAHAAAAS